MKTQLFYQVAIVLLFVTCVHSNCQDNKGCRPDECCIEYAPYLKRCSNKPNDPGERCGGQFLCQCLDHMECVPDQPSIFKYFKVGTGVCKAKA